VQIRRRKPPRPFGTSLPTNQFTVVTQHCQQLLESYLPMSDIRAPAEQVSKFTTVYIAHGDCT